MQSVTKVGNSRLWQFPGTSLDLSVWNIDPKIYSLNTPNENQNIADPKQVNVVGGHLRLHLYQKKGLVGTNPNGCISTCGMIHTIEELGYGSYEFFARYQSSSYDPMTPGKVISGSLGGLFNYKYDSLTELDMEMYGGDPGGFTMGTYDNPAGSTDYDAHHAETSAVVRGIGLQFQTYKFVWTQGAASFFVDGSLKGTFATHVGTAPANLYVSLFGANYPNNLASFGKSQYLLVKWIRYTAPGDTPIPIS